MGFFSRLFFAWSTYFRILFSGDFASRVARLALPEAPAVPAPAEPAKERAPAPVAPRGREALQLLSLLQRSGRLIDFLEQDITSFSDADVGVAARVLHEGCRKALSGITKVVPIRSEEEGASVTIQQASPEVSLVGNVSGAPPFRGILSHAGWRAEHVSLPELSEGHDAFVLAPAEVTL